ncbi:MAG: hypothetical protein K9H25_14445 [Rhodospirillum sp.]|nr:hypothetical protein [Rhodospirillum sp.]MCF8491741.1 hypothetical protein [Rhodospirillum sp.]MCF8501718.1 hypothetical protein [Rhodospirillum sp.]
MSVASYLDARRGPAPRPTSRSSIRSVNRTDSRGGSGEAEGKTARTLRAVRDGEESGGPLTTAQFTRHIAHVVEDQTRAALDRYVGAVGAGEIVDMARHLGQMKARYIAQSLAVATDRKPPTRADAQEMRWMREQIEELELAFQAIRDAISSEMIPVRDLGGAEARAGRPSNEDGPDMLS